MVLFYENKCDQISDKFIGTANMAELCCLSSQFVEMLSFNRRLMKKDAIFPT